MFRNISFQLNSHVDINIFISYLKNLKERRKNEFIHYSRLKELQKIMKNHDLCTLFQPIVNLNSGETLGYETLNRPAVTNLFPDTEQFYEFIGQSDQVLLFESFSRNLSFKRFFDRNKNIEHPSPPLLFFNIHPCVLLESNVQSEELLQFLSGLGIEPKQVVFELVEKSAVPDFALFEEVLSNYRSHGFRIALDDVGTGYNSLKTLIYLKPEFVKLDKSLVQKIDQNREQQQLVKLVIEYAKQSSIEVIAEGIERPEDLAFVRELGAAFGQGYALGKPQEEIRQGISPVL